MMVSRIDVLQSFQAIDDNLADRNPRHPGTSIVSCPFRKLDCANQARQAERSMLPILGVSPKSGVLMFTAEKNLCEDHPRRKLSGKPYMRCPVSRTRPIAPAMRQI